MKFNVTITGTIDMPWTDRPEDVELVVRNVIGFAVAEHASPATTVVVERVEVS